MPNYKKYVSDGAKLKCSFGSSQPSLSVMHPAKPVNIGGACMANIMDYVPMKNIQPFGQCKSLANPTVASATAAANGKLQEMPCIPVITAPWSPGEPTVMVKGMPALTKDSKCMCMWAGMIEITDSGVK
jgi:hypothetical protein